VKLTNLTIAPKLGILVGGAVFGLCLIGAVVAYLTQRDMPNPGMLGLVIAGLAISSGSIAWMIGRSVSGPLGQLLTCMQSLADGELDADIPGLGRGDELGAMAATVQMFKDKAVRIHGIEKVEAEAGGRATAERRTAMETLANYCERSINGIVRSVTSAAAGM